MNSFVEDFKYAWSRQDNGLVRLIIINVAVFVLLNLAWMISAFSGNEGIFLFVQDNLAVPPTLNEFVFKPWTLITYFFTHQDFFHILFNMLIMYWFGLIVQEFLGNRKLVALYILGGIAGGLAYLILFNTIPFFIDRAGTVGMIGASASVYAIVVGAATFMPEYRMNLIFFGPVKIKYIAAVYILLSFFGITGGNSGGNVAHLGGALIGFTFVIQLKKGDDWSRSVYSVLNFFGGLFKAKPKIKVSYNQKATVSKKKTAKQKRQAGEPEQAVIDAILDKISESGYEKLTAEEKQILFKASQKKS